MNTPAVAPRPRGRLLLIVLGAIVALIGIAWALVAILLPPAKVQTLVQAQLARTLNRDVRFAGAGVSIFPPVRLTVGQLAVSEAGGFPHGVGFQASAIHLDVDAFALLRHRVVVRRLEIDDPGIHLVLHPDGTTNWENLVKPSPPEAKQAQPLDLEIRELTLRNGRLLVDDLKAERRRTLTFTTQIALTAESQAQRYATTGTTTLGGYAFGPLTAMRVADLNGALAKLELRIRHEGAYDGAQKRLALQALDVELGGTKLHAMGTVDDPGPRAVLNLHASGSGIDFGEILKVLSVADAAAVHGIHGSGRMDFDVLLRGSLARGPGQLATGGIRIADASFQYPGAPVGVEALSLTARLAPDSIGIGDLTARVGGQPVRARLAAVHFADPSVDFAVQGDIDLAAVAPMVAPKDTKLSGRVGVNVAGRGRAKNPAAMAVTGTARLAGVRVESPQTPKPLENVNGTIAFSQTHAAVQGLSAKAGTSSFTLDGDVTAPLALMAKPGSTAPSNVTFDFRSPRLDLAELLPPASGPPIVLNATGGGNVRIDRLINQKLDVTNVRAQVGLQPGIMSAPSFALNAYGGAITGSGSFDLRDPKRPAIALKTTLDSLSADAFVGTWVKAAKSLVQGTLNTTLDFSVAGATPDEMKRTLTAIGLATLLNGQIGPSPVLTQIAQVARIPALGQLKLTQAKLPFHIQNGKFINDPATIHGPYGDWKVAGGAGFDGSLDYAVSATLPPAATQALAARSALAAGALTDANGNLLLDLRVTGNAKSPRVAWDPTAMRDRLAGKVSEAIAQQQQKAVGELRAAAAARESTSVDSARRVVARLRQSATDSLKAKAGGILRGFFGGLGGGGGAKPDTTKP